MTAEEIADLLAKENIQEVNRAFFLLLKKNKVSYVEISKAYNAFLKERVEENQTLIAELGFSLAMYKNPELNMGTHDALRIKSNKALIASGLFKGTEVEQDLIMNREEHYEPEERRGKKKMVKKS